MGSIYCLFSTEDDVPRYVGQEQSGGDRFWQHVRDAKKGDRLPVHRWMRSVYFKGYDVETFIFERAPFQPISGMTDKQVLNLRERVLIYQLPSLMNIKNNSGSHMKNSERSKKIEEECRKQTKHFIDNYRGFHGIRYYKDYDAFTVKVCYGYEDSPCHIIQLEGDELAGWSQPYPSWWPSGWPYWFTDLVRALNAREDVRQRLNANNNFPPDEVT